MCEKRQNVSERLKKENLHSGQEDAPYYTDAPTMPEGVRGVNSFARHRQGLPAPGGLVFYPLAYPAHDWHSHAVPQSPVARGIRAICGRLAAIRNQGVVIREALKAFAFARGKTTYLTLPGEAQIFVTILLSCAERADTLPPCANAGGAERGGDKVMVLIPGRAACPLAPLAGKSLGNNLRNIKTALCLVVVRASFAHAPGQGLRYGSRRGSRPATASKARIKGSGNVRPLFSARRSIPAHAFALKKYRRGRSPVSKMSDNEDATASLGDSKVGSVKHSPRARIPDVVQRPEECPEVPSSVC